MSGVPEPADHPDEEARRGREILDQLLDDPDVRRRLRASPDEKRRGERAVPFDDVRAEVERRRGRQAV